MQSCPVYRSSTIRYPMPKKKLYPLPNTAFQILLALADEDLHGYGIMRQVQSQTQGKIRLGPGTLYSSLQSLLEEGLIAEGKHTEPVDDDDERRRYYHLTLMGRKLACTEADRLAALLREARKKNILRGEYV